MYEHVLDVLLREFLRESQTARQRQETMMYCDLLATRIADTAKIKTTFPVFGDFRVSDIVKLAMVFFPEQTAAVERAAKYIFDHIEVINPEKDMSYS
jgi:hypothetical protein